MGWETVLCMAMALSVHSSVSQNYGEGEGAFMLVAYKQKVRIRWERAVGSQAGRFPWLWDTGDWRGGS
jgi:hypothetical protein